MNRIIFGSANHWTSPYQVGSHAWARLFARHGWRTLYLSDPVTPWHWLDRNSWERTRERFALWFGNGVLEEESRLKAWTPFSLVSPRNSAFFRSDGVLRHWPELAFPSVQHKARQWGFESPDLLWLDSVRHAGWGMELRPKKTVLRVADWSAGLKAAPRAALELEQDLVRKCDLVVVSAQSLEERLKPLRDGKPMATIRNGVDFEFWNQPVVSPEEYAEIPAPRIIYVGALDEWFDLPLLFELARALPKVSFVLIGQRRFPLESGASPSNVYWLGVRPRGQARAWLRYAQLGIIPFRRTELIECVCPLKLYEYMACGLPVVATRWKELEYMRSPALLAEGVEEWVAHLQKLLEMTGSFAPLGASSLARYGREKLLAYARENDWRQRWRQWEVAYQGIRAS